MEIITSKENCVDEQVRCPCLISGHLTPYQVLALNSGFCHCRLLGGAWGYSSSNWVPALMCCFCWVPDSRFRYCKHLGVTQLIRALSLMLTQTNTFFKKNSLTYLRLSPLLGNNKDIQHWLSPYCTPRTILSTMIPSTKPCHSHHL